MENVSELRMKIMQLQTELLKQQGENHISYVQHKSTETTEPFLTVHISSPPVDASSHTIFFAAAPPGMVMV